MNRLLILLGWLCLLFACKPKLLADYIIVDARIQLTDSAMSKAEALVVGNGKVLGVGTAKDLLSRFQVDSQVSVGGKYLYPGLIDAHCHFYGLGMFLQMADLSDSRSFHDAVDKCIKFYSKQTKEYLLGRGWDQNKWPDKAFPTNEELNNAFPDIPVLLKRVDGHAAIANDYALKLAGIHAGTKVSGGAVMLYKGKPSGVLVDNAVDMVERIMPKPTQREKIRALLDAEKLCFSYGITAVTDAGLDNDIIWLIDSLQQAGALRISINAMVSISKEAVAEWIKRGPYKTDRLQVNSFKMYADGALGSRGACLLMPYHDDPANRGFLLTSLPDIENYIEQLSRSEFQLNTHAIGDSANRVLLKLYGKYVGNLTDRRWRLEHAQVVNAADRVMFRQYGIIPSVQPTHATSDMYWAEDRLGSDRIQEAYAYLPLLEQNGWMPLGTDFPVEQVSPFYTFYAAVSRKDANGYPATGFIASYALSREQALKGMTCWAAMGSFQEKEMGNLAPGSYADFVILPVDLMNANLNSIRKTQAFQTYMRGVPVLSK